MQRYKISVKHIYIIHDKKRLSISFPDPSAYYTKQ